MKKVLDEADKTRLKEFNDKITKEPENVRASEDGNYNHIPIGYVEADLRDVYNGLISINIKNQQEMFGGITMWIRLKVFHPVYETWQSFDGTAGVVIEQHSPGEWKGSSKVNQIEELKTAIALCYSEAIKNAAKKIGPRFGSDINRTNAPGKQQPAPSTATNPDFDRSTLINKMAVLAAARDGLISGEEAEARIAEFKKKKQPEAPAKEVEGQNNEKALDALSNAINATSGSPGTYTVGIAEPEPEVKHVKLIDGAARSSEKFKGAEPAPVEEEMPASIAALKPYTAPAKPVKKMSSFEAAIADAAASLTKAKAEPKKKTQAKPKATTTTKKKK